MAEGEASANMALSDIVGAEDREDDLIAVICPKYFMVADWDSKV